MLLFSAFLLAVKFVGATLFLINQYQQFCRNMDQLI